MNRIATGVIMMTAVMLASCGGNDTPEFDKSIVPAADSNKAVPAANTNADAALQAPQVVTTAPNAQMQQAQTISAGQAAQAMPAAGLNPAHGQPGHRCDIAVGAPLNSAPATATQPQVVQAASSPAVPVAADANAKLNPAHGQPGHDCSIPVGAPLKKG
jgi:hypothetical protein